NLPRRTPGGRGQQIFETSNRLPVAFVIGGVDDWLDEIDTRMHKKRAQGRPNHRLAANGPILLWNVRSSAFAAPRCHNHGSHCPGHSDAIAPLCSALSHVEGAANGFSRHSPVPRSPVHGGPILQCNTCTPSDFG